MSNPAAAGCHTFTLLFYNSQDIIFAYNIVFLVADLDFIGTVFGKHNLLPLFDGHWDYFPIVVSFARTDFYNLALVGLFLVHGFGNENPRLGF